MKTNATDYAKLHGISTSGARARLEKLVHAGKAKRVTTYREWYNPHHGQNGQHFGTVRAIDYVIADNP